MVNTFTIPAPTLTGIILHHMKKKFYPPFTPFTKTEKLLNPKQKRPQGEK